MALRLDSLETSFPLRTRHRTPPPTHSPSSWALQPGALQPPCWSALRAAFPAQPTVPRRGWALPGLQCLGEGPPSEDPGLAQVSGLHGPGGKGRSVVLSCHVHNIALSLKVPCVLFFAQTEHLFRTLNKNQAPSPSHPMTSERGIMFPVSGSREVCGAVPEWKSKRTSGVPLCPGWSTA